MLTHAADLLEARGWVPQRTYRSSDRSLTALLAITMAVDRMAGVGFGADLHEDTLDVVCRFVWGQPCGARGSGQRNVSAWERQRGQTTEAVIEVLRAAAQRERLLDEVRASRGQG